MRKLTSIVLISFLSFSSIGCRKPTLSEILLAAQFSVQEACSVEWLVGSNCDIPTDAIKTAQSFVNHGTQQEQINNIISVLQDTIMKLPPDSRVTAYLSYIIPILERIANG